MNKRDIFQNKVYDQIYHKIRSIGPWLISGERSFLVGVYLRGPISGCA